MNRTAWITVVVVALVVGGGGFYAGETYQAGQAPAARTGSAFAGRTGTGAAGFAGRAVAGGGATFGTIVAKDASSITVQLPSSTSTTATTGSKVVLYDSSTQVQELQSVAASGLTVGQSVTVTGTANSDGSITAQSIQVRPATTRGQ
jgi:hypothetical protein